MFPIYLLRFRKRKIARIPVSFCSAFCDHEFLRFLRFAKAQNMAEIAGIFLSPLLQVFFEKMASPEFVDFFQGRKVNDELLTELKIKLLSMNTVVEDAEDKQFTKPDVKVWLDMLKDAVYDAEDVLDEIATKAMQRKLDAELGTFGSKMRGCFLPVLPIFSSEAFKN